MPSESDASVLDRIRMEVENNDVVLFMNGSPVFPQCSQSAQIVHMLGMLDAVYKGIDVLSDPGLKSGLKIYSDWPNVPQLFVRGVFIGGADIVREMFQTGELEMILTGIAPDMPS